jgi:hypothetical protein
VHIRLTQSDSHTKLSCTRTRQRTHSLTWIDGSSAAVFIAVLSSRWSLLRPGVAIAPEERNGRNGYGRVLPLRAMWQTVG